jgi:predicted TIM-barrel fold metal-dependent hydrolase
MGYKKSTPGRGKRQVVVDVFCHYLSESVRKRVGGSFPRSSSDPDIRLKIMDEYGIGIQAISLPSPVLLNLSVDDASEMCRSSNSDNYALCKAFPDRFVNTCLVSLLDVKEALEEMRRGVNELDCRGITIATNQNGQGLDSEDYFPFYEKLVEYDLPLFLHPTNWESYPLVDMEKGWRMMLVFGWPFDTTQAVWRLIFGGVIDRFPALKVVTHHLGAMLPFFARRIEQNVNKFLSNKLPRHIGEYWAHFYGDTALDGTVAAYPCGYAFFGPDRMMYGSDYPYGLEEGKDFVRANLEGVRKMKIPAAEMKKILSENAKKLLKIK